MSSLLLINPFAQQPPSATSGGQTQPGPAAPPPSGSEPTAVQASNQSGTENNSGSSTSYSGTGAGAGGAASQQRPDAPSRFVTPTNADPASVVTARVAEAKPLDRDAARQIAIDLMRSERKAALIESIGAIGSQSDSPPQLPKSETARQLPDPLPTSPFLKRNEPAA